MSSIQRVRLIYVRQNTHAIHSETYMHFSDSVPEIYFFRYLDFRKFPANRSEISRKKLMQYLYSNRDGTRNDLYVISQRFKFTCVFIFMNIFTDNKQPIFPSLICRIAFNFGISSKRGVEREILLRFPNIEGNLICEKIRYDTVISNIGRNGAWHLRIGFFLSASDIHPAVSSLDFFLVDLSICPFPYRKCVWNIIPTFHAWNESNLLRTLKNLNQYPSLSVCFFTAEFTFAIFCVYLNWLQIVYTRLFFSRVGLYIINCLYKTSSDS